LKDILEIIKELPVAVKALSGIAASAGAVWKGRAWWQKRQDDKWLANYTVNLLGGSVLDAREPELYQRAERLCARNKLERFAPGIYRLPGGPGPHDGADQA
jgi:hypothetical protein